jgi:hypothetical protein
MSARMSVGARACPMSTAAASRSAAAASHAVISLSERVPRMSLTAARLPSLPSLPSLPPCHAALSSDMLSSADMLTCFT